MTATVAHIWRHPIKAHGREALERVDVTEGTTMPWDRVWAVTHDMSKAKGGDWISCSNFSRAARTPTLQAITAQLNEGTEEISLHHPDLPSIRFHPDRDADRFLDWVAPLMDADRPQSMGIVRVADRGMTDSDFPSYSLNNLATHQAISAHLGQNLSPVRWRGNLWFDGLAPWAERDWVGKTVRIGSAEFEVREEIGRCKATTVNPATGQVDIDTLRALRELIDDQNFGVVAYPIKSGRIALGDPLEVL
ncbi:MAG: MOSC N-terminal beta barrel domain-containing protein [Pseudomonadota bacterium]